MTKEMWQRTWESLEDGQRAEAEKLFQEKKNRLFKWREEELKKIYTKLKVEGRFQNYGLDANTNQPEVRELMEKFRNHFNALPEECLLAVLEQDT